MSLTKEAREHRNNVLDHLDDGGKVTCLSKTDKAQLSLEDLERNQSLYVLLDQPAFFEIIERPMVYVFTRNGRNGSITTDNLADTGWKSIKDYISREGIELIQSTPIEEQTDAG